MGNNNIGIYNEITAKINIGKKDINKEIRIINSFEEYKRRNIYKSIDGNEKEIKKCKIEINNEIISFSYYYYKFNKKGKYNIKYSFKNKIKY